MCFFPGGAKLRRSPVAKAAVRTILVVILAPPPDDEPGLGHAVKPLQIQEFTPELSLKPEL